eukprot:CAMPEP_0183391984 /NCGR_PEP_ID=MMETSP0370-20130417/6815_1 /TAXON_ID=268820 /ORGANISM="Peridinium aciculiferum, Strain PAER-2" /LENGTH=75 /DNA_ID=CAMNT_0025571805 /DNA_START=64 /DNA_END=287 /DNA_ORIENTATION=+
MALLQAVRAARLAPILGRSTAAAAAAPAACRMLSVAALQEPKGKASLNLAGGGLGQPLNKRHAGVSVLGCAIAMV